MVVRYASRLLPMALIAVTLALALLSTSSARAEDGDPELTTIAVDPFVWQLNKDYSEDTPSDTSLPISRVLIKTHDGTDWMSTYDEHPNAISGPQALKSMKNVYTAQGIEVVAWFVPKTTDVDKQLEMAKAVIDTGVTALYADVEPFAGFCYPDCAYLADTFWKQLRQQRPNATLGVIYDPREQWIEPEAAAKWLKNADVALPMCYWESYYGKGPWADPAGCVIQGYYSLRSMANIDDMHYEPALQGDATPARFTKALDAALDLGSERVAVWRRATVLPETWDAIANYAGVIDRPCWLELPDGCLLAEIGEPAVYLIAGGAKFHIPNPQALKNLGYTFDDVDPAPDGFMDTVPDIPRDDTLITEYKGPDIYIVYGGARFRIADSGIASPSLVFNLELTRIVPAGGLEQVPTVPTDYNLFREETSDQTYLIAGGGKIPVDDAQVNALNAAGFAERIYLLPDGTLTEIPQNPDVHGDVSCNGVLGATDALMALQSIAGIPNPGVCSTRDLDCSGSASALDVQKLLRTLAALEVGLPDGCPAIGTVFDAPRDPEPAPLRAPA